MNKKLATTKAIRNAGGVRKMIGFTFKSLAFCILVEKYNQYKKGSLRFRREAKFRLSKPALRIAKPL